MALPLPMLTAQTEASSQVVIHLLNGEIWLARDSM